MVKQFIDKVTVTGADDSIDPASLIGLSVAYPFIEFGILCSKNNTCSPRFPSQEWVDRLWASQTPNLNLSMHLCGSWVRSLCVGDYVIQRDWINEYIKMFGRIQLNFHRIDHRANPKMFDILRWLGVPIIYQMDDVNNGLFATAKQQGVDCYPLYDVSGGRGVLPQKWIAPTDKYCGYAGGLSPENVAEQMEKLSKVVGNQMVWIDAETNLRSNNDSQFDIDKVIRFVNVVKPYVVEK